MFPTQRPSYLPNAPSWKQIPTLGAGGINSNAIGIGSAYRPDYYQQGPQRPIEVEASCERKNCYKSCRLMLLGGGRCTSAGCMCYHAFFDAEGKPTSQYYPEDSIWYELSTAEKREMADAMREGVPHRPPASGGSGDNGGNR